jgi:hypothetical protein
VENPRFLVTRRSICRCFVPLMSVFSAQPWSLWSVDAEAVIAVGSVRTRLRFAFLSPMSGPQFKAAPTLPRPSLVARKSRRMRNELPEFVRSDPRPRATICAGAGARPSVKGRLAAGDVAVSRLSGARAFVADLQRGGRRAHRSAADGADIPGFNMGYQDMPSKTCRRNVAARAGVGRH